MNLTLTTGLYVQELTVNTDSEATPAHIFGANDDNLNYLKSQENSPEIKNTSSDISALIEETGNIHEVVQEYIEELHNPRVIFNQDNELDPAKLVEEEANQAETPLYNGGTPPLLNRSTSQSLPLIDSPNAPDSHPPGVCKDMNDAAYLESVGDFTSESLTDANDKILGVYQDWVHQNIGMHLDGGIEEDSKW